MPRDVCLTDSYWSADTSADVLDTTLGDLLRELASEVPDRIALVEGVPDASARRRWTYLQLLQSAEVVARSLLRLFQPGERVAVWSANSAEWVLLQHGAALAGLVLVTVNPAYLAAELAHVLGTAKAAGIFHTDRYRDTDMAEVIRTIRSELPQLREVISFTVWDAFVAVSNPTVELPLVAPGDMIQIQFTSGTTGKPKGACLHHRGVINAARFAAQRAGVADGAPWASAMPLFHVGGCAGSEIGAFSRRGTFVLLPSFDAGVMLDLIESEQVQHVHAVPTMLLAMLEHASLAARDLTSLKTVMSGGSSVPASLVRRASATFGCRFTITFGQTELNGVICQTRPDDEAERQATTIGQPAPQMEVKIADPETGAVLPLGEPGEIWARGYQTMLGYFNAAQASDQAITPDGWLKTGDQATMDAAGYLRITGRLKDCIIRGGENVYPREIEDVLATHPTVRQASVVGVPDPKWGEVVAAVVVLNPHLPPPDAVELHAHCRKSLAAYKTPAQWFYVDAFPTTSSGKIQKFALRESIRQGGITPQPFAKPVRESVRA
ncbi:AMP-binding protein [Variovorax sp. dw_308]|uniref:AMP-binding protein n=1 Tax=Variovorax sp. dw_308 TaxID=2721546 RepID=UPI001C43A841|nr:AMP-binding protein [Variovorax sp. dw_308]